MSAVLELTGVHASPWGSPLLVDIDLALGPGEIHGLIGPNGAGKTSLLRCISGDLPIAAGSLRFGGRPLQDWPLAERARCLAVLPQQSLLNFPFTVEEVVLLGRTPHDTGHRVDRQVCDAVITALDIAHLRGRPYTQLSGGEKQRVQLARVFAQVWLPVADQPRLVLLDEPTAALDLAHQQQLVALVKQLAGEGCTLLLVVHDFNLLSSAAQQLSALRAGRCVAQGEVADVMTTEVFQDVFGVAVSITEHPVDGRPVVIST